MKSKSNPPNQTTMDNFLGGAINLEQPKTGFRSSMDAVFLAASIPAQEKQKVLELGCGVGAVLMCLGARVSNLELNGIEIQKYYADLAKRNAKTNSVANIYCCDIQNLPLDIKERSFDHVISNPPFYAPNKGTPSKDFGKDISLRELLSLAEWVKIAYKRLKPRGFATFIVGVDRLPDILIEGTKCFGNIKVKPICSRVSSPANRVLIQMQKDTKGPFSLLSPLVVHKNLSHETDLKDFSNEALNILERVYALQL